MYIELLVSKKRAVKVAKAQPGVQPPLATPAQLIPQSSGMWSWGPGSDSQPCQFEVQLLQATPEISPEMSPARAWVAHDSEV